MESSIHRFRVSRVSPGGKSTPPSTPTEGRRSASPDAGTSTTATTTAPPKSRASASASSKAKSVPACDRCRSFKKKCSRTFPVCSLCAHAGQKCSYSTPLSSSAAQLHHLRARVEWLSLYVNKGLPLGVNVEEIETGTDLTGVFHGAPLRPPNYQEQVSPPGSSAVARGQDELSFPTDTSEVESSISERNYGDIQTSPQIHPLASGQITSHVGDITATLPLSKPQTLATLPADAIARRFVDAYFRNVNRAYPFVNRTKVLNDLEIFGTLSQHSRNADSTLLYLIMAIGCTTLQRAGEIPPDTAASRFEIPYSDIIQECLCKEDIESLQILVLLALYSLFDPKSTSTWSIVGIVSRQAMLLGLTQRDPDEKALSAIDIELRRRLFWSMYVLDRMMASSLGMSPALVDNNLDVPLPGLTLEEFASCDRAYYTMILQTSRHVIQLRRLEDRILQQVHLNAMSPHTNRPTLLKDIRADIENWYSHGCLISPTEPDNVPIHNSITWLGARYYFLLILLYFPTQPSSEHTISQCELLRFTQKHLQLTSALFQQNQLPLNKVTLFRLFPVGVVMIHSYITSGTELATSCPVRDEVATLLAIFEAFPESWKHAHHAADIFRQFLAIVDTIPDLGALRFPQPFATSQLEGSRGTHHRTVLRSLFSSLSALMQDALGKSSCYRIPNPAEETMMSSFEMSLARQEPLFNPVSSSSGFHAAAYAAGTGVNVNEEPMPDYEFRPLDLDFL